MTEQSKTKIEGKGSSKMKKLGVTLRFTHSGEIEILAPRPVWRFLIGLIGEALDSGDYED